MARLRYVSSNVVEHNSKNMADGQAPKRQRLFNYANMKSIDNLFNGVINDANVMLSDSDDDGPAAASATLQ